MDALREEGRRRPNMRWEDCVKKDLAGVGGRGGGERVIMGWRTSDNGGVETAGEDGSETGSATEEVGQTSTTVGGASLTRTSGIKSIATTPTIHMQQCCVSSRANNLSPLYKPEQYFVQVELFKQQLVLNSGGDNNQIVGKSR